MILDVTLGIFLLLIGIVLFAVEIIHPGALLLIPATVVLAVGILILVGAQSLFYTPYGPAIIVSVALAAAVLTIPYYRYVAMPHKPMSTITSNLEGELGVVIAPVVPDTLKGKVRVNSEVWSARSSRPIPSGTRVRILRGEGVSVEVEPVASETPGSPQAS